LQLKVDTAPHARVALRSGKLLGMSEQVRLEPMLARLIDGIPVPTAIRVAVPTASARRNATQLTVFAAACSVHWTPRFKAC